MFRLFQDLTGHRPHVLWHEAAEFKDPDRLLVLCPVARTKAHSGRSLATACVGCHRDHWHPLDKSPGQGRLLAGVCGATCFWTGLQVGSWRPVTMVLRDDSASPHFAQAAELLRQILRESEAVLAAETARRELARIRDQVPQPAADPRAAATVSQSHAYSHAAVRKMLDLVHECYHRPLDLTEVAAILKMNASYLSSLFSSSMGVSFHSYLTSMRIGKAKELLGDPAVRVCEVAAATGFTSPNHFNNVFKAHTGQAPSDWRNIARNAGTGSAK